MATIDLIMDDTDSVQDKPASDETELLLRFVAHRDHACPRCGYNLRNLTQPVCPECGEALKLTVGRRKINDALFILTLAPCIFSGICAILLSGLIAYHHNSSGRSPPMWIWGIDGFGMVSGFAGLLLFFSLCWSACDRCSLSPRLVVLAAFSAMRKAD